jgi:hypothetical protein
MPLAAPKRAQPDQVAPATWLVRFGIRNFNVKLRQQPPVLKSCRAKKASRYDPLAKALWVGVGTDRFQCRGSGSHIVDVCVPGQRLFR